ncbi:DNA-directed RNA polymerase III subunit RPC3 isoform X2 [Neocloeon triangulifer]|uniref:DNA-directed RNA polymerase III subunit RPC3 isoform X2 n=1 Tax=Neocloeon triangulifer TaxID=2078957 RepID=UPI00286F7EF8|nr:DNA-directed RNA polymerase III subunit RPC3 isoform X2 [Neocloeon triangulifer]
MSGTCQHAKLCSIMLKEAYGDLAEKVAMCLFRLGNLTLQQIIFHTNLKLTKVQHVLRGLINFGIVEFELPENAKTGVKSTVPVYFLRKDNILFLQRYIRGVPVFIKKFGTEGEIMLDTLMKSGRDCASGVILVSSVRILRTQPDQNADAVLGQMKEKMQQLVQEGLIERVASREPVPDTTAVYSKSKALPEVNMPLLASKITSENLSIKDASDTSVVWQVSRTGVSQLLRDEMFAEALTARIDYQAGNLVRCLLQLMSDSGDAMEEVSNIFHKPTIHSVVKMSYPGSPLEAHISEYLQVLAEDSSNLLSRVGDAAGGEYQVTLKAAILELTWSALEKIAQEQFGSKGARIFRTVRRHQFIGIDEVQNHAMLPAKEAKQIAYRLVGENFLQLKELKLGTSTEAGKTTTNYYFFVSLTQLVRMCLEKCYLAQYSASLRQNDIVEKFSHTIQKEHRLTSLYMTLKQQGAPQEQLEDIAGMLTLSEREDLQKVVTWRAQLNFSEYDIDSSILLFEIYIKVFQGKI